MISRQHRFHGYSSLSFVYRRGSTVRDAQLAVRYVYNQHRDTYRAAVIVSRKIHKAAVDRNRARRRLYEIIRALEPHITKPYDIVLTVFSEQVVDVPQEELQQTVERLLNKAGIIETSVSDGRHGIVKAREEVA